MHRPGLTLPGWQKCVVSKFNPSESRAPIGVSAGEFEFGIQVFKLNGRMLTAGIEYIGDRECAALKAILHLT